MKNAAPHFKKRAGMDGGFSLIEVVLAMGIAVVALVSAIAAMSLAVDTNGASARDTTLAAMNSQVLTKVRAIPFPLLWLAKLDASAFPLEPVANAKPQPSIFYFSVDGELLNVASGAVPPPEALFQCILTKTPDAQMVSISATKPPVQQLLKLQLAFSWPVNANTDSTKRPGQKLFYASVARE